MDEAVHVEGKIKHRQRKCGKEKTAEECVSDFESFSDRMKWDNFPKL